MLVAAVALGIQRVLLTIATWWPISAALTVGIITWCCSWWRGRAPNPRISRGLVILLLVRFAVPVVTVGSDYVFQEFLRTTYARSLRALEDSRDRVEQAAPAMEPKPAQRGLVERLKDAAVAPITEVRHRYEVVRSAAESGIERMVDLIVVFVLQTLIMPILFLWGLIRATRILIAAPRALKVRSA
jgi:hypothetical protein